MTNQETPCLSENPEDGHNVNTTVSSDTRNEGEIPPKLEQVVEKVVELHSLENINEILPDCNQTDKTPEHLKRSQENKDILSESIVLEEVAEHPDVEQDKQKLVNLI